MFAGLWPASSSRARARKAAATAAMRSSSPEAACSGRGFLPTAWGSESLTPSDSPSPRKRTTARYSISGETVTSTPGMSMPARIAHSRRQVSVGIRPALRSVIEPEAAAVQKFSRAATSPGRKSRPRPRQERAPRPILRAHGSYPNRARCAGPLPGVNPAPRGEWRPQLARAHRRSRLGSEAVSSSLRPVSGRGSPPRPSMTRRMMRAPEPATNSSRVSSELITAPRSRARPQERSPARRRPARTRPPGSCRGSPSAPCPSR